MTRDDWERALAEKPHDADLRKVHADWLEDHSAPAEEVAEQRRTGEVLAQLFALPGIVLDETSRRGEGGWRIADEQTGLHYGFNATTGYIRRFTRMKRRLYDRTTGALVQNPGWRSDAINPPWREGDVRKPDDPVTMRKVHSLAEQVEIVLRAIERSRKRKAKEV